MTQTPDNSNAPLVTVTIAAYNAADFVAEAIESALAQTYRPLEILVCDDGSTDQTAAIVRRYDAPVRLIQHERNRGLGATRNTMLRAATGQYMALLDADDLWEPTKIARQVAAMEANPEAGLCHTGSENFGSDSGDGPIVAEVRQRIQGSCFATLLERNGVVASSALARISTIPARGFYEDLRGTEDYAMWLDVAARSSVVYLDETLVRIRRHAGQMTSSIQRMQVYGCMGKLRALDHASDQLNAQAAGRHREQILSELRMHGYSRYWNRDWIHAMQAFGTLRKHGVAIPWKHRVRAWVGQCLGKEARG